MLNLTGGLEISHTGICGRCMAGGHFRGLVSSTVFFLVGHFDFEGLVSISPAENRTQLPFLRRLYGSRADQYAFNHSKAWSGLLAMALDEYSPLP